MRDWLAQWPRRLQFFAVVLSLLAAIAPAWHVCALGGHVIGHEHGSGHGDHQFTIARNADGSPGPFICACASHYDEKPIVGNALAPRPPAHEHVNCLALLLQNMPVQLAAPPALWEFAAPRAVYAGAVRDFAAFAAHLPYRGRAPPVNV